jgi:hypothetical protein
MKKELEQNEAIEVLNSPVDLEDEILSSVTGGCSPRMVSCTCGLIEYEQEAAP